MNSENNTHENTNWFTSPIIHYPLWFIFAWKYTDFIKELSDTEVFFSVGIFIVITSLWGFISKMFFLRIPVISKYIYENDHLNKANAILLIVGVIAIIINIVLYGIIPVNNYWEHLVLKFN
ncbi:hypothetical protein [Vallitalea guaymasensis]|uniref:hypothetical protein n=1 Tax=Vallitalea guaymasensis TaxID=1185412 RepID=UPI000DE2D9D9|nr:hypothetical protein [Vallitalea guaymasensis]